MIGLHLIEHMRDKMAAIISFNSVASARLRCVPEKGILLVVNGERDLVLSHSSQVASLALQTFVS